MSIFRAFASSFFIPPYSSVGYGPNNYFGLPSRAAAYPATSYPAFLYNLPTAEQYLAILDVLSEMQNFSITGLTTRMITDGLLSSMRDDLHIIAPDSKHTDYIKKAISDNQIPYILRGVLDDYIYYGSYTFVIGEEYELLPVYDPVSTVLIMGPRHDVKGYIVNTSEGMTILKEDEKPILYFGTPNLLLYTNAFYLNEDDLRYMIEESPRVRSIQKMFSSVKDGEFDPFVRHIVYRASAPLFYYSRVKLREYIIKQIVLSLITLKDLLYPVVYLLKHEVSGGSSMVQDLADQIENILNTYVDAAAITGVRASLQQVLASVTYNIRVLPDFMGSIADLASLDTTKITEKLEKYKTDLKDMLEEILGEVGVPADVVIGRSTWWESMKSSERFMNLVASKAKGIDMGLTNYAYYILSQKFKGVSPDQVRVSIFDLPSSKVSSLLTSNESIKGAIEGMFDTISAAIDKIKNTEHINKEVAMETIQSMLRLTIPNSNTIVDWEGILKEDSENVEEGSEDDFGEEL